MLTFISDCWPAFVASLAKLVTPQPVSVTVGYITAGLCQCWLHNSRSLPQLVTSQPVFATVGYSTASVCNSWLQYSRSLQQLVTSQPVPAPFSCIAGGTTRASHYIAEPWRCGRCHSSVAAIAASTFPDLSVALHGVRGLATFSLLAVLVWL